MKAIKDFIKDESGIGIVELVLILVILIGLVAIFGDKIGELVRNLIDKIIQDANSVTP